MHFSLVFIYLSHKDSTFVSLSVVEKQLSCFAKGQEIFYNIRAEFF